MAVVIGEDELAPGPVVEAVVGPPNGVLLERAHGG